MSEESLFSAQIVRRGRGPSLSEVAVDAIRDAIFSGRIQPGEWLRQERLAQELNMNQMTVREALAQLIAEGLIVREPRRGVRTVIPSLDELEELYTMRAALEGVAMERAATRITSEELARMRELLPQTVPAPDTDWAERALIANREFHWIGIQASRGRHLMRTIRQLLDVAAAYLVMAGAPEHERFRTNEVDLREHTLLLQALEARDGVRAGRIASQHALDLIPVLRQHADRLRARA
jgi:DNA-binding GntR family transcriptional regulator